MLKWFVFSTFVYAADFRCLHVRQVCILLTCLLITRSFFASTVFMLIHQLFCFFQSILVLYIAPYVISPIVFCSLILSSSILPHFRLVNGQYMDNTCVWLNGLVVSALGMITRRPRFESWVVPLFYWVANLGKLFTHIASPVSQLQETGLQKGVFGA